MPRSQSRWCSPEAWASPPYHAGAYQAFSERTIPLHWIAGSSAGAVTTAVIAGNRTEDRIERLREFWNSPPVGSTGASATLLRHLYGWIGAIRTRLTGSAGQFHPRVPSINPFGFRSLYDSAPMQARMARLIDFGRLNSGEMRVCVAATDIETGEPVIFDSVKTTIEMDHLMASCGFLPEFAPVEVRGRLLGDGGLSLNAPLDPILQDADNDLMLYIVDLFPCDGERPTSLEAATERKSDLMAIKPSSGLRYAAELRQLRRSGQGEKLGAAGDKIVLLSYRPGMEEPGLEKPYEFSGMALAQRWNAGLLDMREAANATHNGGITWIRRAAA